MKGNKIFLAFLFILLLPITVQAEDDWDFKITPYAWFAGVKGNVSTVSGSPIIPIDISASDALSDLQASFMMSFEAKKKGQGMLFDTLYTDIESDTTLVPAISLTMKSISRNTIFSAAYLYEVYNQDQKVVDIFGGLRYWKVDTTLEFGIGLDPLSGRRIRESESWVDPLIGIKGRTPLGNSKFYAVGWFSVGGFGIGSDMFYDTSANIGYQWTKSFGSTLGYRIFDVKYEEGDFFYDVKQEGWVLGLSWAF